ncbi:cupredoxin domain-containing protein [Streptomyces roseoverticillatus]|nr:plastocyanin/azurin family copper-binding protein [Streptomyces roseoverticillatus]MCF3102373.1 cupredoxin domain-containing protein [Streptomyces roseoverticillatus]
MATVSIRDFAFVPDQLTVAAGDTVTWTNEDGADHTVTADDGSFGSGPFGQGGTFSHTFTLSGMFPYHCDIHPEMRGTVTAT